MNSQAYSLGLFTTHMEKIIIGGLDARGCR